MLTNFQGGAPSHGYDQSQGQPHGHDLTQQPNPSYYGDNPTDSSKPPKPDFVSGLLGKVQNIGSELAGRIGSNIDPQAYATYGPEGNATQNRHGSFAPERNYNNAKWYVNGCSYMWAVSRALETAKESIWILDCRFYV